MGGFVMPDSYANGLPATGVAKNGAFIGACELVRGGREPKVASLDGGLSPQTQKRIEDGKLLVFVWRVRICCLGIVAAGQQPVSARARFLLTPLCACESLHNWRGRRSQDARLPGFGFESAARVYSNHSSVLTGVSAIERLPDPCCLLPDVCFRRACRQRPSTIHAIQPRAFRTQGEHHHEEAARFTQPTMRVASENSSTQRDCDPSYPPKGESVDEDYSFNHHGRRRAGVRGQRTK